MSESVSQALFCMARDDKDPADQARRGAQAKRRKRSTVKFIFLIVLLVT